MKIAYKPVVKLVAAAVAAFFAVSSIQVLVTTLAYTKPAGSHILTPIASGVTTCSSEKATLDASDMSEGHVTVEYTRSVGKTEVQITRGGSETYTYDLSNNGIYEVFPSSKGSGSYSVKVFENIQGSQYSQAFSQNVNATMINQFGSFLYPNQYVNFDAASAAAQVGASMVASATDRLEMMSNVYNYIINNVTCDAAKAGSVQSGYLPNVDVILARKRGICLDYAALMTAMLRSQDIPTRLVVGYTGSLCHAWINTYLGGQGWVDNIIYLGGNSWKLMDPTPVSSSGQGQEITWYVGSDSNYRTKYSY